MRYKRTELAGNIGFSTIIDEKFKTCSVYVRFMTELTAETAAVNSLAVGTLSASNGSLRSVAELNERLSYLYGSALGTFTRKRGDIQILGLSASWISPRYALDGEDLDGEMLDIIRDCLFCPNAENGEFDRESFTITKNDLLDRIDAEVNNKRNYAILKASAEAFADEPAAVPCYGTRDSAEAVTPADAYSAYLRLLRTSQTEIYYVAPEENPAVAEMFDEAFAEVDRQPKKCTFRSISPCKEEPVSTAEEMDVLQCKTVLTFKSDSDDIFALRLLSAILGETPVSKLFVNVREKLSLCYYCACRYISSKNVLMIDSGVERENIPKAEEEILRQLDEIKNGNITADELESAVLSLDNALTAVGDTPSSWSSWYFERFCDGSSNTPQQQFSDYRAVTKARIVQAALSLRLDSKYCMLSKEVQG